ncbi:hypothetical protein D3C87_259660 [compost metagenome]
MKRMTLSLAALGLLSACAPQGYQAYESIADQTMQDIACKNQSLETKLWDGLKSFLIEQKSLPLAEDLSAAMRAQAEKLALDNPQLQKEDVDQIAGQMEALVKTLLEEAPQGERVQTPDELLILLSAIDVGDRTTTFRSYMQDKVRSQFAQVQKTVSAYDLNCPKPDDSTTGSESEPEPVDPPALEEVNRDFEYHKNQALRAGVPLAVFGGRWTFATAYQSCQTTQIPAMDARTPDVKGISITGRHSDGVGSKRMISSLSQVQATHTYVKDVNSYGQGCFNVRSNPLIYDYGGKPYATTATNSPIDFFKNKGSGTSVLGFDCSGFVFTAMATAGLKLKSGRVLKASDAWAWGSGTYVEPQKNGLTCLNKISVTTSSTIKPGDIVAVYGHVLMVDKVGSDPFGIASARTESDCSKITSKGFDFVVSQSSNSKNGIGINYFEARDYLPTSEKMKAGLEKYAYYACLSKVNGKTYTPNVGTLSVVRHKGTPDCVATRVKLSRESCIQSCGSFLK